MAKDIKITIKSADKDILEKVLEIADAGFPNVKVKNLVKDIKDQAEK